MSDQTHTTKPPANNHTASSSDMEYYYKHLYPFKEIFTWLNHAADSPTRDMTNREFAMAFRSGAYRRYNSFNSVQEFKLQIAKNNPDRFEIGAIYSNPPRERDSLLKSELKPLEKELVFDIDMDDYDSFRTCCSGAMVCSKCWKFISLAMQVVNVTLREDFGFNDIVWVFSGRRGAHCWVSDRRARILNDIQRRNILDYVNVIRDRGTDKRLSLRRPYHPLLSRSLEILKPHFVQIILEEQDPWQDDQRAFQFLLSGLHDRQLIESLKVYWTENPGRHSKEKWEDIDTLALKQEIKPNRRQELINRLRECKEDLVMATLYPKLDVEVTKQTIHLLKAPFCIHPATGNVCVPIIDGFEPNDAPKLRKLLVEMEENDNNVERTSLNKYIKFFHEYTDTVLEREKLADIKREHDEI